TSPRVHSRRDSHPDSDPSYPLSSQDSRWSSTDTPAYPAGSPGTNSTSSTSRTTPDQSSTSQSPAGYPADRPPTATAVPATRAISLGKVISAMPRRLHPRARPMLASRRAAERRGGPKADPPLYREGALLLLLGACLLFAAHAGERRRHDGQHHSAHRDR